MASEKFIERINAREIEAFKEIYDRYYRTLVVYAANFIEDGDVGEDLVQELIINIWENRMTFTSLSTFNAYLYNAVRNASLNYLKHEGVAEKYMEYLSQTYSPVEEESEKTGIVVKTGLPQIHYRRTVGIGSPAQRQRSRAIGHPRFEGEWLGRSSLSGMPTDGSHLLLQAEGVV